jgi:hypothetical protein
MNTRTCKLLLVGILNFTFVIFNCRADLTATVTPGYTYGSSERPTTSTLNRLGTPSITISGTIGGTNAGIAAGSVNGSHLAASVVDGVTIDFTNSSPQALRVRTPGLAGPGLIGGTAGGELTNNVDGIRIAITNDVVTLTTNIPLPYLACPSNYVVIGTGNGYATNIHITNLTALVTALTPQTATATLACNLLTSSGTQIDTAHGLGVTPGSLRTMLVCTSTEEGYAVGDEIDGSTTSALVTDVFYVPYLRTWCNSTNMGVVTLRPFSEVKIYNKTTGAETAATAAKWTLKLIARP